MKKSLPSLLVLTIAIVGSRQLKGQCTANCVPNPNCTGTTMICNGSQCVTLLQHGNCTGKFGVLFAGTTPTYDQGGGGLIATPFTNRYCKTTTPCQTYMEDFPKKCVNGVCVTPDNPNQICASCGPSGPFTDWVVDGATCLPCGGG